MGSDYPFPLGEVPVPGKMPCEEELGWLTWDERAGMLAKNAIQFLGLEEEFGAVLRKRLEQFRRENGLEGKVVHK